MLRSPSGARDARLRRRHVVQRSRLDGCLFWVLIVPVLGVAALVLAVVALSAQFPGWTRALAGLGGLVLIPGFLWYVARARPRRWQALRLELGPDGIAGTQHRATVRLPREDIWFVAFHEIAPRGGVPEVAVLGHGGELLARWQTQWDLMVGSLGIRWRLDRAGLPWVHRFNHRIWKRRGVDERADAAIEATLETLPCAAVEHDHPGLGVRWRLPPAWFFVPLGEGVDRAIETAIDERAGRDPLAGFAPVELATMLLEWVGDRDDDPQEVVLVRWGEDAAGALVTGYASVGRPSAEERALAAHGVRDPVPTRTERAGTGPARVRATRDGPAALLLEADVPLPDGTTCWLDVVVVDPAAATTVEAEIDEILRTLQPIPPG